MEHERKMTIPGTDLHDAEYYMSFALKEAKKAAALGEIPVGAVIVDPMGKVIARAHNLTENHKNATLHAEIVAISKATRKLKAKYLMDCKMYVTLEPCPMCAAAISHVKLAHLYFAAVDEKGGAVTNGLRIYETCRNLFRPKISQGPLINECSKLLTSFFKDIRHKSHFLKKVLLLSL